MIEQVKNINQMPSFAGQCKTVLCLNCFIGSSMQSKFMADIFACEFSAEHVTSSQRINDKVIISLTYAAFRSRDVNSVAMVTGTIKSSIR